MTIEEAINVLNQHGIFAIYHQAKNRIRGGILAPSTNNDGDTTLDRVSEIQFIDDIWIGWVIPGLHNVVLYGSMDLEKVVKAILDYYKIEKESHNRIMGTLEILQSLQIPPFFSVLVSTTEIYVYKIPFGVIDEFNFINEIKYIQDKFHDFAISDSGDYRSIYQLIDQKQINIGEATNTVEIVTVIQNHK